MLLRLQNGRAVLHSGIDILRFSICIGRDEPFGAKPPQAGSTESLMFPAKGKELFYHKGCKFTYVGVDQTSRRPLAVSLFRNCCGRNCISKDNGQFQKAKLRRARRCSRVWSHCGSIPRLLRVTSSQSGYDPRGQPAGLVCSEMTRSRYIPKNGSAVFDVGVLRLFILPRSCADLVKKSRPPV